MRILAVLLAAGLAVNAAARVYAQGAALAALSGARGSAAVLDVSCQSHAGGLLLPRSHGRRRRLTAGHSCAALPGSRADSRFSAEALDRLPRSESAASGDGPPLDHPPA